MQRNLMALANQVWDVVVIGGGIYGASVAWEAAGRGLSVALLEKKDFASATSANSLKTIHGGFRYLQHLDFGRVRESVAERKNLMRIAPHLVHPMPVLVPAYGHGMKGREVLAAALAMYEAVSFDRNDLADHQKHIPAGRIISKAECLDALPDIDPQGLTGGALFYDAQVYNSERLVLAFLQSAAQAGAAVANYAGVIRLLRTGEKVTGVQVRDELTGETFDVQGNVVVNAAGPWIGQVLYPEPPSRQQTTLPLAKAVNVITRPIFQEFAVGLMGQNGYQEKDKLVARSTSLLFVSPWRGKSIIGTTYAPYTSSPDGFRVSHADVSDLVKAFNIAYPQAELQLTDVSFAHAGLLPAVEAGAENAKLLNHYRILDHSRDGAVGLLSVVGVKYTTARQVAEKVVDRILAALGKPPAPSKTANTPLDGGQISDLRLLLAREAQKQPCGLDAQQVISLIYNYGSAYSQILKDLDAAGPGTTSANTGANAVANAANRLLQAQIRYAVRYEMALHLEDALLRRTDLASAGLPDQELVELCAAVMAQELKWDNRTCQAEIAAFKQTFDWMAVR